MVNQYDRILQDVISTDKIEEYPYLEKKITI